MDYTKKITYHSNYWYNDGLKRAQIRDTSGAIVSLRRSLQYNRENIAARNLLGLVYYGRGEVAEALVEWIISRNFRQRDNIANEYLRNIQNSNKELGAVNQAVKRYNQCLAYCAQGAEDMAVIQLKRAVSMHPTFLKAYQLLALLYLHSGQYAQARQMLKEARKLDTTNEMTLRYMQELKRMQGRRSRQGGRAEEPGKNEIVEYKRGNDTLIQPRPSTVHRSGGGFFNLLIGMLMGAAIVWFLIAPAVQESKAAQMNKEILDYSERIGSLEAQISAQTRMLDSYRATSADTEAAAQNAAIWRCTTSLRATFFHMPAGFCTTRQWSHTTWRTTMLPPTTWIKWFAWTKVTRTGTRSCIWDFPAGSGGTRKPRRDTWAAWSNFSRRRSRPTRQGRSLRR